MKRPVVFFGWWIVLAAVLVGLYVGGIVVYGFTAIFAPLIAEFGWSYATVSFAASLRGAESGVLEPVMGRLVARWGPRRVVFAGGLFTAGGLLLLSKTTSLVMYYGAFVLLACGMSSCGTTVLVTGVANWFRKRLAFATGVALCGFGLGGLVLPVLVSLIARHGWRNAFELLALGALLLILPLSLVFRHHPEDYGYTADGEGGSPGLPEAVERASGPALPEAGMSVSAAVRERSFWCLTLAFTFYTAAIITTVTHVMPYLEGLGISRLVASMVATAIPVLSIAGRLGLGWMADRRSRSTICIISYIMMSAGTLCFAAVSWLGAWSLLLFVLLFSVGYGGVTSLRPALIRQYFGRAHFGSVFGLVVGINAVGGIAGPPLAGWAYDSLADYRLVWFVLALLALAAAALVLAARRQPEAIFQSEV